MKRTIMFIVVIILILVMVWYFTKPVGDAPSVFDTLLGRRKTKNINDFRDDGINRPSISFEDVFTPEECAEIVSRYSDKLGKNIQKHDATDGNNHYQRLLPDSELVAKLKERLTERALASNDPQLIKDAQQWVVYDQVRIVHYSPGQEKTLHKDSQVVQGDKYTAYTVLLYLSDVPEAAGGRTISYPQYTEKYRKSQFAPRPSSPEYREILQAEQDGNALTTQPKLGKLAMYDVHLLHRGEAITEGEKWLAIFKVLV